jgi:hypothetical protein
MLYGETKVFHHVSILTCHLTWHNREEVRDFVVPGLNSNRFHAAFEVRAVTSIRLLMRILVQCSVSKLRYLLFTGLTTCSVQMKVGHLAALFMGTVFCFAECRM